MEWYFVVAIAIVVYRVGIAAGRQQMRNELLHEALVREAARRAKDQ